jgi:phosphatidate cytidylyltransferase
MKQRVTSAILIIAVALPILIYGSFPFIILGLAVTIVAAYEMIQMRETVNKTPLEIKAFAVIATVAVAFQSFNFQDFTFASGGLSMEITMLFMFLLLCFVVLRKSFTLADAGFYLIAILYVGGTLHSMLFLRSQGLNIFIFMILVAAITDSFAYFVGRRFGKHKLAPLISPKKTVEGSIGGTIVGVLTGVVFGIITNLHTSIPMLLLMSLVVSIVGQLGDLVASSMKREYKIKDFGKIFPGHGGVLDRLDSHMFSSLALYLVLNFMDKWS